jgi:hypothetical protein
MGFCKCCYKEVKFPVHGHRYWDEDLLMWRNEPGECCPDCGTVLVDWKHTPHCTDCDTMMPKELWEAGVTEWTCEECKKPLDKSL